MPDASLLVLHHGALFHERYRIVRCLAAGGMGAVYEVVDVNTDSPRALKVILPSLVEDAEVRARFALEARITGGIQSDHLVQVTDAGLDAATGTPFLVMELLSGSDLGALVERRGPLPPDEVTTYLAQAAMALDKTHAAGVVHRDLKPENLFVTQRDDGSPCVKILDFGIAKLCADSARARQTRALGTPIYMSPEQVEGTGVIDPRADLYALGHIAYTLLAGEAFWTVEAEGTLLMLLSRIVLGAPEAPSERARRRRGVRLPPGFDAWFRRATATDPAARFERATLAVAAFGEALGVSASPRPVAARVVPAAATLLSAVAKESPSDSVETMPRVAARTFQDGATDDATGQGRPRRIHAMAVAAAITAALLAASGAAALALSRASERAPTPTVEARSASLQSATIASTVAPSQSGEQPTVMPREPGLAGPPHDRLPVPKVSPGVTVGAGPVPPATPGPTSAKPRLPTSAAPPPATGAPRDPRPLKDEGIY